MTLKGTIDLRPLQDAALEALTNTSGELSHLLGCAPDATIGMPTLTRLLAYQGDRGTAVLHLVSFGLAWDAEIILRAFYETTARILHICLTDAADREGLIDEYWNVLGGIGERRMAVKSERTKDIRSCDSRGDIVMEVFRNPALFAVNPKEAKAVRKRVEQRWSFSEIIAVLSRAPREEIGGLPELAGYLHGYGRSSHLLHADPTALDFMEDRRHRPPAEAALLEASHAARIFTDVVGLRYFSADALRVMLRLEFADPDRLRTSVVRCMRLAEPAESAFYTSQTEFYREQGYPEFGEDRE